MTSKYRSKQVLTPTVPMVAWMSRHQPTAAQWADLAHRGYSVKVIPPPPNRRLKREGWSDAAEVLTALQSRMNCTPALVMLVAPVPIIARVLPQFQRQQTTLIRAVMRGEDWSGEWVQVMRVGRDKSDWQWLETEVWG